MQKYLILGLLLGLLFIPTGFTLVTIIWGLKAYNGSALSLSGVAISVAIITISTIVLGLVIDKVFVLMNRK